MPIYANATRGKPAAGWENGLNNIPATWNLAQVKLLYNWDFDQENRLDLPTDKSIKELAKKYQGEDYIFLDLEGWGLIIPGTYRWGDWTEAPEEMQERADDAAAWNQRCVDMRAHVLTQFRKYNQDSKLAMWGLPAVSYWQTNWYKKPERSMRWPDYDFEYHGALGTQAWACEQLKGMVDYAGSTVYWPSYLDQNYFSVDSILEKMRATKTLADISLDAPCCILFMNRKVSEHFNPEWFSPEEHSQLMEGLAEILRDDDLAAWWEGSNDNLAWVDSQLADQGANHHWIQVFDQLFRGA